MKLSQYRVVLANPTVRRITILGLMIRVPLFGSFVVMTLHVVEGLGMDYAAAGLVTTFATIAIALAAPWRGRMLDRLGLRKTMLPSLIALPIIWSIAPWVPYPVLLALVVISGLLNPPVFSIVRQGLITAVPQQRRMVLALDSVATEVGFMIGPVLGVLSVGWIGTAWTLLIFELCLVLSCFVLTLINPELKSADPDESQASGQLPLRKWITLSALTAYAVTGAGAVLLTGSDISVIAAMRAMDAQAMIGPAMAIWALGSAVGGLIYGSLRVDISPTLLLAGMGIVALPVALSGSPWAMMALLFFAGLLIAPTLAATVEALTTAVPERARGEALGWHGSFLTAGSALGAPLAGFSIDQFGWPAGFVITACFGLLIATLCVLLLGLRRRRHAAAS